jgi:hypothetical protein
MSKRPNVGRFGIVPFVVGDLAYRKLPPFTPRPRSGGAAARSEPGYWHPRHEVSEYGFRAQVRAP